MRVSEVEDSKVADRVGLSVSRDDSPQAISLVGHDDSFLSLRPDQAIDHKELNDYEGHCDEDGHSAAGVVSTGLNPH